MIPKHDPKTSHKVIPIVDLIFINNQKVLLQLRQNTGFMDGHYSFPGGHVEVGEFGIAGAIREIREELGVEVTENNLELVHVMYKIQEPGVNERIFLYFMVKKWSGEILNNEPEFSKRLEWFDFVRLPENTVPYTKMVMEKVINKINYSEYEEK